MCSCCRSPADRPCDVPVQIAAELRELSFPDAADNARARSQVLFHEPRMPAREKTIASEAAAVLAPADSKRKSVPIWLVRDAGWARQAPLTEAQRAWVEAQGFKGQRQEAPAPARQRRHAGRRGARSRRGARARSDGQAGAVGRPAAGRTAERPLSPGQQPRRSRAGGRCLGPRRLSLPALQDRQRRSGCAAEAAARRRSRARACDRRGRLAGTRPHQHAGQRSGAAGAGGGGAAARQAARSERQQHCRR